VTRGRARTVFIGSGGFGLESLRRLEGHDDVDLVGVVTAPARPAGRGERLTSSVIQAAAEELAVPRILTPQRLRAPDAVADVLALDPELIVLADYGQIVPPALLGVRHGALNLHPSLLPRHRGATPIPATILAGDAETGVTLIQMDEGLDTGPIVAQEHVPLQGDEVAPGLEAALAARAGALLAQKVGPWVRNEIDAVPQREQGATLTKPLRREDGRLDLSRSPIELERQIRAYQPWPGSFLDTAIGRLIVWKAERTAGGSVPGTFDLEGVGTDAGGGLRLIEVQPAGGKRMAWDAFVRGRPAIVGSSIVG
jgi:methionyl-tRNA formyltransferase